MPSRRYILQPRFTLAILVIEVPLKHRTNRYGSFKGPYLITVAYSANRLYVQIIT